MAVVCKQETVTCMPYMAKLCRHCIVSVQSVTESV